MTDTLAPRALVGIMTPAMNTVVQPELELLRPDGVTNQMQRFRLGGDTVSEDFLDEANKLMDCAPLAIAVGLTTDAGPGGPDKLRVLCDRASQKFGISVLGASQADYEALRTLGANRIGVVTPFDSTIDTIVKANTEAAGFEVITIKGTNAPSLPAICETSIGEIRDVFNQVASSDCEAILQVGTALPVVGLIAELEKTHGRPIVACNAAVYWQTLRAIGINDPVHGYGQLLEVH